jgi:hypothetical protein
MTVETLGRFGHHPDPAIDFELEVQDLEDEVYNFAVGFQPLPRDELNSRIDRAMNFRVGGDPSCIKAKDALRRLVRRSAPARVSGPMDPEILERCCRALCDRWGEDPDEMIAGEPQWMTHEATAIFVARALPPWDGITESKHTPEPSPSTDDVNQPQNEHTRQLVRDFAAALGTKLRAAEEKYGYSDGWRTDDWQDVCKAELIAHVGKGDPLDVAAYAAFCWARGWTTSADELGLWDALTGWLLERELVEKDGEYSVSDLIDRLSDHEEQTSSRGAESRQ